MGYDSVTLKVNLHVVTVKQLKFQKIIHKVTEGGEYTDEKLYNVLC
jgi:hypothetical protein